MEKLRHVCHVAEVITDHPFNNVTENIFTKIGANLHRRPDHPICIIKEAIYSFFDERHPDVFRKLDDLHPVVSAYAVRELISASAGIACYRLIGLFNCMYSVQMIATDALDCLGVFVLWLHTLPQCIAEVSGDKRVCTLRRILMRCLCQQTTSPGIPMTPTT